MKIIIAAALIVLPLSSCATTGGTVSSIDPNIVALNGKVQKYCLALETASGLANVLYKKTLVSKINAGIDTYCNSDIKDATGAIIVLSNVMKAVNNAGLNP